MGKKWKRGRECVQQSFVCLFLRKNAIFHFPCLSLYCWIIILYFLTHCSMIKVLARLFLFTFSCSLALTAHNQNNFKWGISLEWAYWMEWVIKKEKKKICMLKGEFSSLICFSLYLRWERLKLFLYRIFHVFN